MLIAAKKAKEEAKELKEAKMEAKVMYDTANKKAGRSRRHC
jgi:F0F1-type ATP synthase membrane subunit b/b'